MRVSRKALPLKVHYFLFFGSVAPMLPFLMVVGMQLGVPVQVQGSINALILLLMVFIKPLIAAAADSFPAFRKPIFLLMITLTAIFFSIIWLIKPFTEAQPRTVALHGRVLQAEQLDGHLSKHRLELPLPSHANVTHVPWSLDQDSFFLPSDEGLLTAGGALPSLLFCRLESCGGPMPASSDTPSCWTLVLQGSLGTLRPLDGGSVIAVYRLRTSAGSITAPSLGEVRLECIIDSTVAVEGLSDLSYPRPTSVGQHTGTSKEDGDRCDAVSKVETDAVWGYPGFYVFCLLMLAALVAFSTTNSITDAICLDTIGNDGDYGAQRAWGSVGWGVVGLLSGALVDWWSAGSSIKDYSPAFLLLLLLGAADVAVSALTIKVPKLADNPSVLDNVVPLLRQPRFVLFLVFVVMNGCLDGVVATFIFVLQEEVAACTPAMQHIKLLQGLTLVVQSGAEIPFMFLCDRLSKRFGPERLTTLVFGAYGVRILLLSLMGYTGNVWLTLLAEALNGPCYGLGYTAIVLYAGQISAPGTSATVQSLVNICYEAFGYALASVVGGALIQAIGGPANFLVFGLLACLVCPLHWAFTSAFPAPTKKEDVPQEGAAEIAGAVLLAVSGPRMKEQEDIEAILPFIKKGSVTEST